MTLPILNIAACLFNTTTFTSGWAYTNNISLTTQVKLIYNSTGSFNQVLLRYNDFQVININWYFKLNYNNSSDYEITLISAESTLGDFYYTDIEDSGYYLKLNVVGQYPYYIGNASGNAPSDITTFRYNNINYIFNDINDLGTCGIYLADTFTGNGTNGFRYSISYGSTFGNTQYFYCFAYDEFLPSGFSLFWGESNNKYTFSDNIINYLKDNAFNGNNTYSQGLQDGYAQGKNDGYAEGKAVGVREGFNEGLEANTTAVTIFNGILSVGLLPINIFLAVFNFEILGINLGSFVSSMLTVCLVIIVIKAVLGGKEGS